MHQKRKVTVCVSSPPEPRESHSWGTESFSQGEWPFLTHNKDKVSDLPAS